MSMTKPSCQRSLPTQLFHGQSDSQMPSESLPRAGTSFQTHWAWSSRWVTLSRAYGAGKAVGLATSMCSPESKYVSACRSHQGER